MGMNGGGMQKGGGGRNWKKEGGQCVPSGDIADWSERITRRE